MTLEEKDIEVTLHNGFLTLRGEKKSESQDAVYSERWHGRFERSMQLGPDVDPDRVNAAFKNGVLTITVPKRPEAQRQVKRIPITTA
jgi:HSP20 family protein